MIAAVLRPAIAVAAAVLPLLLVGLLALRLCPFRSVPFRSEPYTQRDEPEPNGNGTEAGRKWDGIRTEMGRKSESVEMKGDTPGPPIRFRGKRQSDFAARWQQVVDECGPPPTPDAVPVVGYEAGGVWFPGRWRTPPDSSVANNFKPGKGE